MFCYYMCNTHTLNERKRVRQVFNIQSLVCKQRAFSQCLEINLITFFCQCLVYVRYFCCATAWFRNHQIVHFSGCQILSLAETRQILRVRFWTKLKRVVYVSLQSHIQDLGKMRRVRLFWATASKFGVLGRERTLVSPVL